MRAAENVDDEIARMLSEEKTFDQIADRLGLTWGQVRRRYIAICMKLGEEPE